MAKQMGRGRVITPALIRKIEVLTAKLNEGRMTTDDQVIDPLAWLMVQTKCGLKSARQLARGKKPNGTSPPEGDKLYADFAAAFGGLQSVVAHGPLKVINKIMDDTDAQPRDRLVAAKFLLEKMWPEHYGTRASLDVEISQAPTQHEISDIPQEVFEEMTDEEFAQFEEWQEAIDALKGQASEMLDRIKKRAIPGAGAGWT